MAGKGFLREGRICSYIQPGLTFSLAANSAGVRMSEGEIKELGWVATMIQLHVQHVELNRRVD